MSFGQINQNLWNELCPYFHIIIAWYWGHEHSFKLYAPYTGSDGAVLQRGRLIGKNIGTASRVCLIFPQGHGAKWKKSKSDVVPSIPCSHPLAREIGLVVLEISEDRCNARFSIFFFSFSCVVEKKKYKDTWNCREKEMACLWLKTSKKNIEKFVFFCFFFSLYRSLKVVFRCRLLVHRDASVLTLGHENRKLSCLCRALGQASLLEQRGSAPPTQLVLLQFENLKFKTGEKQKLLLLATNLGESQRIRFFSLGHLERGSVLLLLRRSRILVCIVGTLSAPGASKLVLRLLFLIFVIVEGGIRNLFRQRHICPLFLGNRLFWNLRCVRKRNLELTLQLCIFTLQGSHSALCRTTNCHIEGKLKQSEKKISLSF